MTRAELIAEARTLIDRLVDERFAPDFAGYTDDQAADIKRARQLLEAAAVFPGA
ncbi:hypothetical protein [Streptomyces cacaoi]|uniref:hypothetical protein n=1 Tax=Streptomyces cacaoi TaxID=1898 RepID=UPI002623F43F|nr:hypothetical protein [Streptomyces cacaoi]